MKGCWKVNCQSKLRVGAKKGLFLKLASCFRIAILKVGWAETEISRPGRAVKCAET